MFNVANRAILVNFVEVDKTMIKEETVVHLHKTNEVKDNFNMGKTNNREPPPRGQGGQSVDKMEFHPYCGR